MKTEQLQANATGAQQWINWTYAFGITDGVIGIVYTQTKSEKVQRALQMLHIALQNVCDKFADVAQDIEDDKGIPAIVLPAVKIADWSDAGKLKDGVVETLKSSIYLVIEQIEAAAKVSTPVEMALQALSGLIDALDKYENSLR